ncbi:MAG: hypothetical protein FWE07_07395 [Turicibacter sp.]|nr:hypothetical protein [Turicibacter sp.]
MNNKIKKVTGSLLLAFLLVTASLTLPLAARADENDPDPTAPTTLIVTKDLLMNTGTTTPASTFNFDLRYITSDPAGRTITGFPVGDWVERGTVSLTEGQTTTTHATMTGVIVATGQTTDLLAGIAWNSTGVYDFVLREQRPTPNPSVTTADGVTETMTYDTTYRGIRVWVVSGPGNTFVVQGVHVFESDADGDFGAKIPEGATFTNIFLREVDGTYECEYPDDPTCPPPVDCPPEHPNYPCPPTGGHNRGLRVSKRITGSMANPNTLFSFTGTLTRSGLAADTSTYTAVVYGARPASATTGPQSGDVVTFTPGTAQTFTLFPGQELRFNDVPIGTGFSFTETDYAPYTPSIDLIVNGTASGVTGAATGDHLVGEAANAAHYLNTNEGAPITGLIMGNLPFILVGLGAAGLIAMSVVNKRRRTMDL